MRTSVTLGLLLLNRNCSQESIAAVRANWRPIAGAFCSAAAGLGEGLTVKCQHGQEL
jgi:hypothetical protein